jgi:hypothetical protein
MAVLHQKSEAIIRGARMLRTALGPAIAGFLEDPAIVEHKRETPRLCRGGSKSLTYTAVAHRRDFRS